MVDRITYLPKCRRYVSLQIWNFDLLLFWCATNVLASEAPRNSLQGSLLMTSRTWQARIQVFVQSGIRGIPTDLGQYFSSCHIRENSDLRFLTQKAVCRLFDTRLWLACWFLVFIKWAPCWAGFADPFNRDNWTAERYEGNKDRISPLQDTTGTVIWFRKATYGKLNPTYKTEKSTIFSTEVPKAKDKFIEHFWQNLCTIALPCYYSNCCYHTILMSSDLYVQLIYVQYILDAPRFGGH